MPWKDEREPTIKCCLGGQVDVVQKVHHNTELWTTIDGEPVEFEWNMFPGFTTLQLRHKVQEFLSNMSEEPEEFTRRIIFMSMFNDISWGSKDNEQECEVTAKLVSIYAGRWSFLEPGSEKKWYSPHEKKNHKENGTKLRSK